MITRPDLGANNPLTTLNKVVLPAPLGPMRPVTPLSATVSETSVNTWFPPKATHTSETSRTGIGHTFHDDVHRVRCCRRPLLGWRRLDRVDEGLRYHETAHRREGDGNKSGCQHEPP